MEARKTGDKRNIHYGKICLAIIVVASLILTSVVFVSGPDPNKEFMDSLNIKKHDDYLYSATYKDYDYEYAQQIIDEYTQRGACSSVYNNGIVGRNYDWYYDETPEFVIRVPATAERHASIGVVFAKSLTDKQVSEGTYARVYRVLPFITVDGVNDRGVECNINVVSYGDHGLTYGTNPNGERLCMSMAVRYVLDYADSAKDAISMLLSRNLYVPASAGLEVHLMITDPIESYVLEIVNNRVTILKNEMIMTNFYLTDVRGLEYGTSEYHKALTPHAMGTERYGILLHGYKTANNMEGMLSLLQSVNYTQTYDLSRVMSGNFWYSEFTGNYIVYGNLTKDSEPEDYYEMVMKNIKLFGEHQRNGITWQTVHTSVYNLKDHVLWICCQEKPDIYKFSIEKE